MRGFTSKVIDMRRFPASILALMVALAFPVAAASLEQVGGGKRAASPSATAAGGQPSALQAIDQNRAIVVDRIVRDWGNTLSGSSAGISIDQLREMLMAIRTDYLVAASVAGTLDGLRDVLAFALASSAATGPSNVHAKALGDPADDLVFTPLTPCRLVDTRGNGAPIQGGPFNDTHWDELPIILHEERRTITPAGACAIPTSNVAMLVLSFHTQNIYGLGIERTVVGGDFPLPTSGGYVSMVAPGTPTNVVVSVFEPRQEWAAASGIVRTDSASAFDVYVREARAHVIIDVIGYFAPPKN